MAICSKYPKELAHYDKRLKTKCFRKLKDNVWECKTKWQLLVTADWTYRFKLLKLFFLKWMTWGEQRQRRRRQFEEARSHYERTIKRRAFAVLRRKIERSWILLKYLRNIVNLKLMRRTWMCWRKYARKSLRSREIELLTVRMRELHLLKSYIELWYMNYLTKRSYQKNYLKAVKYHNFLIKRRAFKAWSTYQKFRTAKRQLVTQTLRHVELKLKERVFNKIMNYVAQKKLYREHIQSVTLFYENYLLRNVLDKWHTRYEELVESRNSDKIRIAIRNYHANIVQASFRKLKLWTEQRNVRLTAAKMFMDISVNLKITFYLEVWRKNLRDRLFNKSLEEKAVEWRNCQLIKIYLLKLVESFEKRKEENMKVQTIISLRNSNIKGNAFVRWKDFVHFRRLKKLKYEMAERQYKNRITQKLFWGLKRYSAWRLKKKEMISHYEKRLLWKGLMGLRTYWEVKRFRQKLIEGFREKSKRKVLKRCFSILRNIIKCSNSKYQKASDIASTRIKKMTFHKWRLYYKVKRKTEALWEANRLILQHILIQQTMSTWWRKTQDRLTFKGKLEQMKRNQDSRLVKKYFTKWLSFIEKIRKIRERCLVFSEMYSDTIIRCHMFRMKRVWEERRAVRNKKDLALRAEKEIIVRRYFKMWIGYKRWKAEKLKACSAGAASRIYLNSKKSRAYCGSCESKRRQPMIPLYLRHEFLLSLNEDTLSSQKFSSGDTHDLSSPVNKNLPVIY